MKDTIPKDLDNRTFLSESKRNCWVYTHYVILHQYVTRGVPWELNFPVCASMHDNLAFWYYAMLDVNVFDPYLDHFIKKKDALQSLHNYIENIRKDTIRRLASDVSALSTEELAQLVLYYCAQLEAILHASGFLRLADRALMPRLRNAFAHTNDPDKYMRMVSVSNKISFSLREEIAILKLAIKLKGKEPSAAMIEALRSNYCWSVCGYFNEKPKSAADYKTALKIKDPAIRLQEIEEQRKTATTQQKQAMDRLDEKTLGHIACTITHLKDYFKESINEMIYRAEPLFQEIITRTNTPESVVKNLLPNEIAELVRGKKMDSESVRLRAHHNILLGMNGVLHVLVGRPAMEFEERYLQIAETGGNEFRGRCASPGTATGIVKVILRPKDFSKLEKGNILVVSNTSPDYVPIMRKAAAIIAEEGGLTAHVSVVSREFSIPCVVGVAHITKILKDGDMVEVDADKGIVRKL